MPIRPSAMAFSAHSKTLRLRSFGQYCFIQPVQEVEVDGVRLQALELLIQDLSKSAAVCTAHEGSLVASLTFWR